MDSYLTSPIVTVAVGRDEAQRTFFLHKDILEQSSGFFKTGLHDYFQSGETKTFDLPEDDPAIFALFAKYIYSKNYDVDDLEEDIERDMDAYIVGEKYLAPEFCQAVFHQLEKVLKLGQETNPDKLPSVDKMLEFVHKIYAATPTGDPLRQLLAKLAASMSGQPCEPANPRNRYQRSSRYSPLSPEYSAEGGSDPEPAAKEVGRKPVFSSEERMKLVEEGGGEFLCDVLGHCVAPREDDLRKPKESKMSEESKQLKEWFENLFGRFSSAADARSV